MSVFKKQAVLVSLPAYDVVVREPSYKGGYVEITAEDILGMDSKKGFFYSYSPGSVVSYALENNDDPIAAVEEAKAKNEPLIWISGRGTCLSDSPQARETLVKVEIGMLVRFEGQVTKIAAAPNNNIRFAPVEEEEAAALPISWKYR